MPQEDSTQHPTDQELVLRTQAGDSEAFDALILRYEKPLFSVIYNILLNHQDTQDVLMQTLIKAYNNMGRFRADAKFFTWIYQIATNESINLIRKRRRSLKILEPIDDESNGESLEWTKHADSHLSADIVRQMNVKDLEKKLNESLAQLSEEHRTVVNLFNIQALSHSEIAQIMKCSEGTVRSRLHYAHKQLQKLLKNYI